MTRALSAVLVLFVGLLLVSGCSQNRVYRDGVYTAEFADFDSRGYKDFMKITVTYNQVSEIVYDGVDEDGDLKSNDAQYASEMEKVQETYPGKYSADLINQYMDAHDIQRVDIVAGATYSSESFIALFTSLEKNMQNGDESLVVIENITEK